MNLHLIHRDAKFPVQIRAMYERALPGRHIYALIERGAALHAPKQDMLAWAHPRDLQSHLEQLPQLTSIVLHGVLAAAKPYIDLVDCTQAAKLPVYWSLWGYEAYELAHPLSLGLLDARTAARMIHSPVGRAKQVLWHLRSKILRTREHSTHVIKRLAGVFSVLQADVELMQTLIGLPPELPCYAIPAVPLEGLLPPSDIEVPAQRPNVLVGNSASPNNNHVDVFEQLARQDLSGRKVIVPLSYGHAGYRRFVLNEGQRILGTAFHPLTDFQPLEDYLSQLASCGALIFNTHRQQAVGNCVAGFWQGQQVYLGPSSLQRDFRSWGLPVHDFQSDGCLPSVDVALDADAREHARNILRNKMAARPVTSRIRQVLGN